MAADAIRLAEAGTPSTPSVEPAFFDVDQLAVLLGISPRSVYRLADRKAMPESLRLGALRRWRRSEVERWIAEGCPHQRTTHVATSGRPTRGRKKGGGHDVAR